MDGLLMIHGCEDWADGDEKMEVELSPNGEVKEKTPIKKKEGKEKGGDKDKD